MLCPHCEEYDISNEVESDPVYTEKEKTLIKELEEEIQELYTLIGEQGRSMYLLQEKLKKAEDKAHSIHKNLMAAIGQPQ